MYIFSRVLWLLTAARALHRNALSLSKITSSSSVRSTSMVCDEVQAWDFLDDVYLITTTQSPNLRLEETRKQLEKVRLWDRVKVRIFKPDDLDRVRGCYTSHISVLEEIEQMYDKRSQYKVLVFEDNLETTLRMSPAVISAASNFLTKKEDWDVFHLAYMMYVPGLSLKRLDSAENVVRMIADAGSSVGTSSYIISKSGVNAVLQYHRRNGYREAIPNIMALLFPESRYASYPMVFHRAGKISSLVNPQLDDFRKIMFNPVMYTLWERLMVSTGLPNNKLFPSVLISFLVSTLLAVLQLVFKPASDVSFGSSMSESSAALAPIQFMLFASPLAVGLWGASLFKPGNTGAGFASTTESPQKR